jgi:hypothetical protein
MEVNDMRPGTAESVRRHGASSALFGLVVIFLSAAACTDVGDNSSAPPELDSGALSDGTLTDSPPEADGGEDATAGDTGAGAQDAGPEDAGSADAGAEETSPPDVGAPEGGDATIADSGAADSSGDTGGPETGAPDAKADSATAEAGVDASGGLAPCTAANPTNCVGCFGSDNNVCSTTEALFVSLDIAKGIVTSPGVEPMDDVNNCYSCLVDNSCLDSPSMAVSGKECEDLSGNFANGSGASVPATATCQAVVSCIVGPAGQQCGSSANGLNFCYCGTGGGPSSQCQGANAPMVNGACVNQEVAGFAYAKTDASDILAHFGTKSQPSGIANNIFACAVSNSCTQCLQ